ncbi:MAG TPA: methyltransferase domain-containing protein [Nitrososphaeraceae archaeon]|jgi:ubiquinone/menaquinone biosynthesis C-methylase UbiE
MNSEFNPDKFKVDQRKSWDSVARGWQEWWETFENGAQHVSDRLIELAGIRLGNRVLDIATGIGEPAISAAKVVGKGGHVTATDMSTEMLAIAEERAKSLGLDNIMDFRQSDAENLELSTNQAFDAILCRWGLMFLPNLGNALVKIHQLLLPGRRLAVAVWSEPSRVPLISMPMSTAREYLHDPLIGQTVPGPFSLADVDAFKKSLLKAGFTDIQSETMTVTFEFDSAEDYTKFNQDIVAHIRTLLANETEKRKWEIWEAINDKAKQLFADHQNGRIKLSNEAVCVVALKQ